MTGLIEEIQRDALNPSVAVSTILRKAKLAAAKLRLPKVEEWVERELYGYNGDLPDYRKLRGRPHAFNPYQGWIPIILDRDEDNDLISRAWIRQTLPSIEDTIARTGAGHLEIPLPPSIITSLNEGADFEYGRMAVHLSVSQGQGIVDTVRDMVLDWAISLDKLGISGEGYSFSATEVQEAQAQSGHMTFNIHGNFAGNVGTGNSSGQISAQQSHSCETIFSPLAEAISASVRDAGLRDRLLTAVEDMKAHQDRREEFRTAYAHFISLAANHMGIVAPFLPALAAFLA